MVTFKPRPLITSPILNIYVKVKMKSGSYGYPNMENLLLSISHSLNFHIWNNFMF